MMHARNLVRGISSLRPIILDGMSRMCFSASRQMIAPKSRVSRLRVELPQEGTTALGPTSDARPNASEAITTARPRASNPTRFRIDPRPRRVSPNTASAPRGMPPQHLLRPAGPPAPPRRLVADWLDDQSLPTSSWIRVDNIPPTSSLQAITRGLQAALERTVIPNLDAEWNPRGEQAVPILHVSGDYVLDDEHGAGEEPNLNGGAEWMRQAHVILSPFARPTGWRIQLANRSLVHAVLSAAQESTILCSSRAVRVEEWQTKKEEPKSPQQPYGRAYESVQVSDLTLRVENCSAVTTKLTLLNLFSRYDLRSGAKDPAPASEFHRPPASCVELWDGMTDDGKVPPTTWLVHFADAASARAALREVQGAEVDGRTLLLVQYPQQKALS